MNPSPPELTPWPHPACQSDAALLAQCQIGRGRSGGPGGQNRNKVETLIELTHVPTGVEAHAGERRSQMENRRVALRRLRLALAVAVRTPVPLGEIGSDLWKSRRRAPSSRAGTPQVSSGVPRKRFSGGGAGAIEVNPDHHDYPALLAEALDVLAASPANFDPRKASLRLEVSATQLTRLIKNHPPAFAMLNAERKKLGMPALR